MSDAPRNFRMSDYLNRDFNSFSELMFRVVDRTGTTWRQRSPADPGVMILEMLAYELDHMAYAGERVMEESFLGTARLRESLRKHAALAGYTLRENQAGTSFQYLRLVPSELPELVGPPGRGHLRRLPAGSCFVTQASPTQPAVYFETERDALVSSAWNTFSLAKAAFAGAKQLELRPAPGFGEDLRRLSLHRGMRLVVGEDARAEIVSVDEVKARRVLLKDALVGEHAERSPVCGNIVAIREGRMTLERGRCGARPGTIVWGRFLRLRLAEVARASDELELARDDWRALSDAVTLWDAAHQIVRRTHDVLRVAPRVVLESLDDRRVPGAGGRVPGAGGRGPGARGRVPGAGRRLSELDGQLCAALVLLDGVRALAGARAREPLAGRDPALPWALRANAALREVPELEELLHGITQYIPEGVSLRAMPDVRCAVGETPFRSRRQDFVSVDNQRVPLGAGQPLLWLGETPQVHVWTRASDAERGPWTKWAYRPELLRSSPSDRHFTLELDNASNATLVFPDGVTGARPEAGDVLEVRWATGPAVPNNVLVGTIGIVAHVGPQAADRALEAGRAPEGRARDVRPLVMSEVELTRNVVRVVGSEGPESALAVRGAIRLQRSSTAAPATIDDYEALVLEQPGVAEVHVWVEVSLFNIVVRLEHDAAPGTLDDLRETLSRRRQAGTFFSLARAESRGVRLTLLAMPDRSLPLAVTRARMRGALAELFAARLGRSLGQPLLPAQLEEALSGVAEWTNVVEMAYSESALGRASPRPLTVAPSRFLQLEQRSLRLLFAKPFSLSVAPTGSPLSAGERAEVFELLSGEASALNDRSLGISRWTVQSVLRDANIPLRVLGLFERHAGTSRVVLERDEVPFLDRLLDEVAQ